MIKKLYVIFLMLIFLISLSSCGGKVNVELINSITNQKQKVSILKEETYSIDMLPNVIDGYYVKGYSYEPYAEFIECDEKINIKKDLYYTLGIKEDYFYINSIGKVYIECDDKITSKEEYVNANIRVLDDDYSIGEPARIRLRGNTTFWVDKKSYKIKFDEEQDLFGMGNDKEWALLANYFDPTHMRNYYAYMLAQAIGLEYYCESKFVEVYLNSKYNGLYLLTETVKTSENRVNIELDTNTDETPFLLELDMKLVHDNPNYMSTIDDKMFLINNRYYNGKTYPFGTKYPKSFKDIGSNQYEYIKDYIQGTYDSVRNGNYEEYIDIDNFIDYFLIQKLFMNVDLDYSSVYLYKKVGEKLKFGPIWDFDLSSGNVGYVSGYSYDKSMKEINGGSYLFNELYKYDEFKYQFKQRLEEINLDIIPVMLNSIDYNYSYLMKHTKKDNYRWDVLDDDNWARPAHLVGISYEKQVSYFKDYLFLHNKWMRQNM